MRLSEGVPKNLTYEPIAASGADVLLEARSSSVAITLIAYRGIQREPTISYSHVLIRPSRDWKVLLRTGYYQRLSLGIPGCWKFRLQAGTDTGYITLWAR
jgi:hypothetical protein